MHITAAFAFSFLFGEVGESSDKEATDDKEVVILKHLAGCIFSGA